MSTDAATSDLERRASGLRSRDVRRLVAAALSEDGAFDDVTTRALVPDGQQGRGTLLGKSDGVVCGLPVAAEAFRDLDPSVRFEALVEEGGRITQGDGLARVSGRLAPILSAERVALNFVQRLSGIATLTRQFVDAVAGFNVRIYDTRKTTPGLRALERYAVRVGGGHNHRFSLAHAVLVKDNHNAAARARGLSLRDIVAQATASGREGMLVEVEVTSVEDAREAFEAGATALLLDNMSPDAMREVVAIRQGLAQLEASGGVTLNTVREIAATGVDNISIGALTHSAPALDISLEIEPA